MKWSMVNKVNSSDFWILEEEGQQVAELKFNIPARTIRINEGEKRLYFLEQTGFMQTRIQLKNEYNQVNGEIQFNKNSNTGTLTVSGNKYSFNITESTLSISNNNIPTSSISINSDHKPDAFESSALLFGYCNHLQKVSAKKTEHSWLQ